MIVVDPGGLYMLIKCKGECNVGISRDKIEIWGDGEGGRRRRCVGI